MNDLKKSDTWKIELTIEISFILSRHRLIACNTLEAS